MNKGQCNGQMTLALAALGLLGVSRGLLAEELVVQSASIAVLRNRLGHQELNRVAGNTGGGIGTIVVQQIRGAHMDTTLGTTTINDVSIKGAASGVAIIQNFAVGDTSTRAGLIRVNTVKSYGFGGPAAVVQNFNAASLRSTLWPITINTYIY